MEVGAVAAMRYVKDGIRAAKLVLEHTEHTLIVGEQASVFAISMGLPGPTDLSSPESISQWNRWKMSACQPNFRKNVLPTNGCGPYRPSDSGDAAIESPAYADAESWSGSDEMAFFGSNSTFASHQNHDTISMAVIDRVSIILHFLLVRASWLHIISQLLIHLVGRAHSSWNVDKWCYIQNSRKVHIYGCQSYKCEKIGMMNVMG